MIRAMALPRFILQVPAIPRPRALYLIFTGDQTMSSH